MSEAWEVVISFQTQERAQRVAASLSYQWKGKIQVRKVNPDAHPE